MDEMKSSRRDFLKTSALVLGGLTLIGPAMAKAQAGGMVDENSAQAKAMMYKADATKITDKKVMTERQGVPFAKQKCDNCSLFQGKVGDAAGGCPLFAGQKVAGKGWCNSWNKKA